MTTSIDDFEADLLRHHPDISAAELAGRLIEEYPRDYTAPTALPERTDALPGPGKVPTLRRRQLGHLTQLWHPTDAHLEPGALEHIIRIALALRNGLPGRSEKRPGGGGACSAAFGPLQLDGVCVDPAEERPGELLVPWDRARLAWVESMARRS